MQAFSARNCGFENVTFRSCHFSNVTFDGVKLENVTFHGVDFQNVQLKGIELSNVSWMEEGLRNALIAGDAFEHVSGTTIAVALRMKSETRLSRTTWFEPRTALHESFHDGIDAGRKCISIIAKPRVGIFEVLEVRSKIMGYLFPCPRRMNGSTMVMVDRPAYDLFGRPETSQTQYTVKSRFNFGTPIQTYHGWCRPRVHGVQQGDSSLNFCLALLITSKQFYQITIPYIYDRGFAFESAESCLAFLHDHQKVEHQLSGIQLKYTSQTNPAAWRRLFNVIVHERRDIKEFVLKIGAEFWNTEQSRQPAREAVNWRGWTNGWTLENPLDGQRTFLQHVARLPGRRLSTIGVPTKAEEVKFFLRIADSQGIPEREAFTDDLQFHLRQMMLQRPELDRQERRTCCQIKQLDECCYWKRPASDK
ncbi:uncharacterized protein MYCFIDRAFT_194481 [Pseudocercospora fijiensis CIRAD86]|uniref:Uncharacterized protein n=1 Tax=Pseudocercospora fijiensis (strain CIRAD86) TaxID=383855 RepID=M3BAS0_PSEFD|nr:uncharacterized protein MYCFIDRAFT_194481 [Pseudocercospora fijiensis CIRAD86]EME86412.1 hypothetical protein MYCFIDRAFT_194481 [Pseudocercospora fijiensis CIRAD86]